MADVFISYSRKDRERCTAIREALTELGVDVWFDVGIGAGSAFDREIEKQIEEARALLVLWSADSVESDWVRNEARTGKVRDRLVAVQIDECELPLEFQSIQAELSATMIVIEHDMGLMMMLSDRVYCLDKGLVVSEGTPEHVREDPNVIASYLGTDTRAIQRSNA